MSAEIGVRGRARGRWAGLATWLLERLCRKAKEEARLELIERIALAPKQSLALVEAEGHRLLVAFSVDGTPVFHALGDAATHRPEGYEGQIERAAARSQRRISW